MILLFVISSLILSLIILVIFVFITIKTYTNFFIIDYIHNCNNPSIIGYTNNGIYTNIIKNKKDKILITFVNDNNDLNATFLYSSTFQIIDKNNISTIINNNPLPPSLLFAFNFNLCLAMEKKIFSLFSKLTYSIKYTDFSFFSFQNEYFIISSLSPLIINKINTNFHILNEIININWNDDISINIKSNPIFINGFFWIIGTNDNNLFFIIFDIINKKIINFFKINIYFNICKGLIYNSYNETFIIPVIKYNKIQIYNIKKNDILSNFNLLN
jgi:hypothetical protein